MRRALIKAVALCPATGPPTFSMCYVNREAESAWGVNFYDIIAKMDQGLKKVDNNYSYNNYSYSRRSYNIIDPMAIQSDKITKIQTQIMLWIIQTQGWKRAKLQIQGCKSTNLHRRVQNLWMSALTIGKVQR